MERSESAPSNFTEKVLRACHEFDSLKVGDKIEIRIVGVIGLYTAEVVGFDGGRWPRLKVLGDPAWADFTLKRDNYIFKRKLVE